MPLDTKTLSHPEFCAAYHAGKVKLHIDKYEAKKIISAGLLPPGFKQGQIIIEWVWFLLLATAITLLFFKWWVSVIIFLIAVGIPESIRRSAAQSVKDYILKNPDFYQNSIERKLVRVELSIDE